MRKQRTTNLLGRVMKLAFPPTLLAVAAILVLIAKASADTLPPSSLSGYFCAGVFQYCNATAVHFPQNTSASYTSAPNSTPGDAFATGSGTLSPIPNLFASATASGNGSGFATFNAEYYIELTGPSGSVPIAVNTTGFADSNSSAIMGLVNTNTLVEPYLAAVSQGFAFVDGNGIHLVPFGPGSSFDRSDTVNLVEGVIYRVSLGLSVTADSGHPQQTASVDPYFSDIPVGYNLLISPDVGNLPLASPASTPLPGTLPLFASGLGAFGLLGWRRKRKNAAASGVNQ